tara:strand:- start:2466 stop:3212 length:747 start_codon:yes stop_codon:yes gene_type:complete
MFIYLPINNILFSSILLMRNTSNKKLPLSGSEPKYTQRLWGRAVGIGNNNCYAYAVGDYESYRRHKSIPGERAGIYNSHNYTHCKDLPRRVMADNPNKVYIVKANDKCKKSFYKIMMFVAPGKKRNYFRQGDFHFYKQHGFVEYKVKKGNKYEDIAKFFKVPLNRVKQAGKLVPGKILKFKANVFSHKRGWATAPLLVDAKGKAITDPRKASRNYPGLEYKKYCSSFCVKNRGIKVGHTHPKVVKNTR